MTASAIAIDEGLVTHYAERGYAVVPAAIGPALCASMIAAVEGIQTRARDAPVAKRALYERGLPDERRSGVPASATGDALFIVNDLCALDPAFAALFTEEGMLAHVCALLGTRHILLHFCNVTMKRSRVGSGIYYHRDVPNGYLSPRSLGCLRVMACLDGMNAENGATVVRVGSHIAPAEGPPTRAAVLAAPLERVYCPPGSLVFLHPHVLHGGPPNHSAGHRRNIVMQWGRRDDPVTGPGAPETLTNFSPAQIRLWAKAHGVFA